VQVLNRSRSYGAGSIRSRHDVCDGLNLTVVHCREALPRHRRSLQRAKRPVISLHEYSSNYSRVVGYGWLGLEVSNFGASSVG
jgi:hypothetical protein